MSNWLLIVPAVAVVMGVALIVDIIRREFRIRHLKKQINCEETTHAPQHRHPPVQVRDPPAPR
jgi:hypothetical protein